MTAPVRLLLLGDTHIGFDWPVRPRVARRRRGPDFLARFEDALAPARRGDVDLVVHGGDLLHHPRVPAALVQAAMEPLFRVADGGVPVFLVPGNHERSRIPFPLLTQHPNVFVFDAPRTFHHTVNGLRVAVAGFPFARTVEGDAFPELLDAAGWRDESADVRLACMHQAVEGAVVNVQDFTFRRGRDVVPGRAIPCGLAAVLSGHIHRAQVLTTDLAGRPLNAPVVYAGSVERTAFAEREETKGYKILRVGAGPDGGRLLDWTFHPLAARPMVVLELDVQDRTPVEVAGTLRWRLRACPPDAVVSVTLRGVATAPLDDALSAAAVRALAPETMNVNVAWPRPQRQARRRRRVAR